MDPAEREKQIAALQTELLAVEEAKRDPLKVAVFQSLLKLRETSQEKGKRTLDELYAIVEQSLEKQNKAESSVQLSTLEDARFKSICDHYGLSIGGPEEVEAALGATQGFAWHGEEKSTPEFCTALRDMLESLEALDKDHQLLDIHTRNNALDVDSLGGRWNLHGKTDLCIVARKKNTRMIHSSKI